MRYVGRVVEQHKDPPAGQLGSQERGGFLDVVGNQLNVETERPKQLSLRIGGAHRYARAVAAEIEVKVAVGVAVGQLMCGLDGQCRFANTAHPGHRDQTHGLLASTGGVSQN